MLEADRRQLRERVVGEKRRFADARLELQLIARHSIGTARNHIGKILARYENSIQRELREALENEYPQWNLSFARTLDRFESWRHGMMTSRLNELSISEKDEFLKPIRDVQGYYMRMLQASRDRLSARTLELFGAPL